MIKQFGIYYFIAACMIAIGFFMTFDFFYLTDSQMNAINFGAAYVTLATTLNGIISSKITNAVVKTFSIINLLLGVSLVFLGVIMNNFNQEVALVKLFSKFDTNPLVLVCLGISVGSIVGLNSFMEKSIGIEKARLNAEIEKLEIEKKQLEDGVKRATEQIEKWERESK